MAEEQSSRPAFEDFHSEAKPPLWQLAWLAKFVDRPRYADVIIEAKKRVRFASQIPLLSGEMAAAC